MEGTKFTNLRRIALPVIASVVGLVFASAAAADVASNSNAAVAISASLMRNPDQSWQPR